MGIVFVLPAGALPEGWSTDDSNPATLFTNGGALIAGSDGANQLVAITPNGINVQESSDGNSVVNVDTDVGNRLNTRGVTSDPDDGEAAFVASAALGGTVALDAAGLDVNTVKEMGGYIKNGAVAANGDIIFGTGFSVTKGGTGVYTINFDDDFPSTIQPSISIEIVSNLLFWSIPTASKSGFEVILADNTLTQQDNIFAFSAIQMQPT